MRMAAQPVRMPELKNDKNAFARNAEPEVTPDPQLPHRPSESTPTSVENRRSFEVVVPRQLKSPNAWNGRHWRYKHRESQEWELAIAVELLTARARQSVWAVLVAMNAVPPKRVCLERRRVQVVRVVPSARNFIRDEDNLRFAVKPLNDALKRLGLIHDDSRTWLEQLAPTQEVSTVGQWATRIRIEAIGAVP